MPCVDFYVFPRPLPRGSPWARAGLLHCSYLQRSQRVVKSLPLKLRCALQVKALIQDPKVEINLQGAKVVVAVAEAQLVEACKEESGFS